MELEMKVEKYLRNHNWMVILISLLMVAFLVSMIYGCMVLFRQGHYWSIIPAAICAHAYFVIVIHDGAHKAISRTYFDHLFSNLLSGFLLLPFFPEPFRKYHLIHHGNTNVPSDPLWAPVKSNMYSRNRYLYILFQSLPFALTLITLINAEKHQQKEKYKVKGPKIRWHLMLLAFVAAGVTIYFVQPPLWFVLGSLFCLTTLGAIRHWCEHMGTAEDKESNTFWFPLGMGVGNHDYHHDHPHVSWISLMIGLYKKKMDTNPLKTLYGILFVKSFKHYKYNKVKNKKA